MSALKPLMAQLPPASAFARWLQPQALSRLLPVFVLAIGLTALVMMFLWRDQSSYKPVFGAREQVPVNDGAPAVAAMPLAAMSVGLPACIWARLAWICVSIGLLMALRPGRDPGETGQSTTGMSVGRGGEDKARRRRAWRRACDIRAAPHGRRATLD